MQRTGDVELVERCGTFVTLNLVLEKERKKVKMKRFKCDGNVFPTTPQLIRHH